MDTGLLLCVLSYFSHRIILRVPKKSVNSCWNPKMSNSGSVTLLTLGLSIKALDCLILSYDPSLLLRYSKRVPRDLKLRPSLAMSST